MAQEPAVRAADVEALQTPQQAAAREAESIALVRSITTATQVDEVHRLVEAHGAEALGSMREGICNHNLVFSLAKSVPGEGSVHASSGQHGENISEACRLLITSFGLSVESDRNGQTPVFFASRYGNASLLQVLLEARSDPSHTDRNEQTALYYAARYNQGECARRLLAAGAGTNIRDKIGQTPTIWASRFGSIECLEVLLEGRADPQLTDQNEQTALHYAARYNQVECTRRLLASGADAGVRDVNGETPTAYAAAGERQTDGTGKGSPESLEVLLQTAGPAAASSVDNNGRTALFCAWSFQCFQALLKHGCCPDVMDHLGRSVLYYVAWMGSEEKVRVLLEHRASTNLRDGHGKTPLHIATLIGRPAICEELLSHGNPNLVSAIDKKGRTAIFESKDVPSIEALLKRKCDPNALDQDGRTALFVAAQEGNIEKLRLLLRYGAEVEIRDRNGDRAIEIAQSSRQPASAAVLMERRLPLLHEEARFEGRPKGKAKAKGRGKAKANPQAQAQAKVLPPRTTRGVPPKRMDAASAGANKPPGTETPTAQHRGQQCQQGLLHSGTPERKRMGPNSAEQTPKRKRLGAPGRRSTGSGPGSSSERAVKPRRYCLVNDQAVFGSQEHQALLDKLLEQLPWLVGPVR